LRIATSPWSVAPLAARCPAPPSADCSRGPERGQQVISDKQDRIGVIDAGQHAECRSRVWQPAGIIPGRSVDILKPVKFPVRGRHQFDHTHSEWWPTRGVLSKAASGRKSFLDAQARSRSMAGRPQEWMDKAHSCVDPRQKHQRLSRRWSSMGIVPRISIWGKMNCDQP